MPAPSDTTPATSPVDVTAHVERLVAEAPPLTPEQVDRLAVLLRPAADNRSAA